MKLGKMLALALLPLVGGCLSTPPADNPLVFLPPVNDMENPVLVKPGQPSPDAYAKVFEKVLSVVDDYFSIAYANRYDGRIVGHPKIAPGYERPWLNGSPDAYERLLATFQTMRHRCFVQIRAAEQGGYMVQVTVFKELQDVPRPSTMQSGSVFWDQATVDRQFAVVDPQQPTDGLVWIPKGRSAAIEDAILKKIRRCQFD